MKSNGEALRVLELTQLEKTLKKTNETVNAFFSFLI